MTADKHAKRAARNLAAREGISYAAARRRLAAAPVDVDQEHQEPRPPVAVPMVSAPCPEGCEGSGHPGTACWAWRPADVGSGTSWAVRRAAELPGGRAEQLAERVERPWQKTPGGPWASFHAWDDRWLLALVYAMLTDQRPELRPDRGALRAAVEADDLAAVDALLEPLDRAAARLTTKVPAVWWGEVKPLLDAYADDVESDDGRDLLVVSWQEVEARHVVGRLVDRWRKAWVPVRNHNGYMDPPGVMWIVVKEWLDARLVDQHGGHAPGARVRLGDGRPAVVRAVEWGEDGPPVAYRVRELEPGRHGNVGRLVPSLTSDVLVPAADCREDRPCGVCGRTAGMAEALCDDCAPRVAPDRPGRAVGGLQSPERPSGRVPE
ncbi:hypothetical protein [Streptomyces mexicanus]|uniref:Uncharacterized protein n=1 Tax=Streptomyces mexicanus TaxID=178566 RepID=A0A7X1I7L2_9ACTN|nr:hypothetical protein [Streptomyces mexicanus]MBC2869811.1 hypothetical protein [Streptomyces mexicanus]